MFDRDEYMITMDSFGSECPENWEEIADYLNGIIEQYIDEMVSVNEYGMEDMEYDDELVLRDRVNDLWEQYCRGELEGAPVAQDMIR